MASQLPGVLPGADLSLFDTTSTTQSYRVYKTTVELRDYVVPEPSTWALGAVGMLGVAALTRRNRRSRAAVYSSGIDRWCPLMRHHRPLDFPVTRAGIRVSPVTVTHQVDSPPPGIDPRSPSTPASNGVALGGGLFLRGNLSGRKLGRTRERDVCNQDFRRVRQRAACPGWGRRFERLIGTVVLSADPVWSQPDGCQALSSDLPDAGSGADW
ncbi:MAG: PEP-CTERM sorting domain-containing protein [Planctomycetaceae bacterium]